MGLLRSIAEQERHRSTVYDEWGVAERMNRGLGITALFAGESGTGKTMAAEVIAAELHLNLYRIDLSAVVSKYIGETEKNLRRLFDAAESGGHDPLLRRGRRAVRQAQRGQGQPRPLRQHRDQLPAPAHGGVPRAGDPRDEHEVGARHRVRPPPALRGRVPVSRRARARADLAARRSAPASTTERARLPRGSPAARSPGAASTTSRSTRRSARRRTAESSRCRS